MTCSIEYTFSDISSLGEKKVFASGSGPVLNLPTGSGPGFGIRFRIHVAIWKIITESKNPLWWAKFTEKNQILSMFLSSSY
jgi:hypothetical protein